MAVYKLDIQKSVGQEYWTNRYFINAADPNAGLTIGLAVANVEKAVHASFVQFVSLRVSTPIPDKPSVYVTATLGYFGSRANVGSFPLTACSRVELFKGPRRPDVRYLRACGYDEDTAGVFTWSPTYIQFIQNNYVQPLLGITGVVDHGNLPYNSGRLTPNISSHQLRSGTRRKKTPVIPVS